jgi:hypothetical protein
MGEKMKEKVEELAGRDGMADTGVLLVMTWIRESLMGC